ncbi:MAG: DNA-binding protein Alba [Desulfurococcales archaeon]|nr:DNA-binding protein Alba [Desulfurococcales archaeon]
MAAVPHPTNAVLVGRKPVMNYVLAALRLFTQEGVSEVVIRARGRNVCKAVDTVETLRHMFMKDLQVKSINIYSEEVSDESGRKRRVSSIEIVVTRPQS